ncbi:MAG: MFS transporter [Elusimicrobia bacterium]|nr:MFS transporter [Elusimicrobiota bacterium]
MKQRVLRILFSFCLLILSPGTGFYEVLGQAYRSGEVPSASNVVAPFTGHASNSFSPPLTLELRYLRSGPVQGLPLAPKRESHGAMTKLGFPQSGTARHPSQSSEYGGPPEAGRPRQKWLEVGRAETTDKSPATLLLRNLGQKSMVEIPLSPDSRKARVKLRILSIANYLGFKDKREDLAIYSFFKKPLVAKGHFETSSKPVVSSDLSSSPTTPSIPKAPEPKKSPFAVLFGNPVLRAAFIGYVLFLFLNPILYALVAPAYGLLVSPNSASVVTGLVTGLYSLGGLLGGLLMFREAKLIESTKAETSPEVSALPSPKTEDAFFTKSVKLYLTGEVIAQIGIESMGLAIPLLIKQKFGSFSAMAQIALFASAAGIVGRFAGGYLSRRLGLKITFVGSTALRLLSVLGLVYFLLAGDQTIMPIMAFYALNGFLSGISATASRTIPLELFKQKQSALDKFFGFEQFSLEIIGVSGPILAGAMVGQFGFVSALFVYPVTFLAAIVLFLKMKFPKLEEASIAPLSFSREEKSPHGFRQKLLRIFNAAMLKMDQWILKRWLSRWIEEVKENGQVTDRGRSEILRRSMLMWMKLGTIGLFFFLPMLLPMIGITGFWAGLPVYLAMIPFGLFQVVSSLKLQSFMASKIPGHSKATVMGVVGALSTAFYTGILMGLGKVFDHFPGITPFLYFNIGLVLLVLVFFWITKLLHRLSSNTE